MEPGKSRCGEQVIPNHELGRGGPMRLEVVPSPYFDVRVTEVAGPIAQQSAVGAVGAVAMTERRAIRSQQRRLGR